jgi:tetratricopeptide (TPR) repeat protein
MAGRLVDEDAAAAYRHARAARRLASRVGVVREACGFAAYHAGEWADALAELRAARRLPGREGAYLPVMADCERGLGRPERALDLAKSPEAKRLATEERVELRIVESGARRDLGQYAVAVVTLQIPELKDRRLRPWSVRLLYAYADALVDAGREDEARDWFAKAAAADRDGDTDAAERLADLEGLEIIDTEEGESEDDAVAEAVEAAEAAGAAEAVAAEVVEAAEVAPAVEAAEAAGDAPGGSTEAGAEEPASPGENPPASAAEVVISEAGVPGIDFSAEQETSAVTPTDPVPEVAFSPPPADPAAED